MLQLSHGVHKCEQAISIIQSNRRILVEARIVTLLDIANELHLRSCKHLLASKQKASSAQPYLGVESPVWIVAKADRVRDQRG